MPYIRTRSLSSGRREEREKQLNIHRPIESGIDSSRVGALWVGTQNDSINKIIKELVSLSTASLTETKNLNHLKNCECSIRSGVILW